MQMTYFSINLLLTYVSLDWSAGWSVNWLLGWIETSQNPIRNTTKTVLPANIKVRSEPSVEIKQPEGLPFRLSHG